MIKRRNNTYKIIQYTAVSISVAAIIISIYLQLKEKTSQEIMELRSRYDLEKIRIQQQKMLHNLNVEHDSLILEQKKLQKKFTDLKTRLLLYEYYSDSTVVDSKNKLFEEISELKNITPKLQLLDDKISNLNNSLNALRQSINPLKPEEVLTIVRLQDEVKFIKESIEETKNKLENDQHNFERAIIRELEASNRSTNLILVVLIPLVSNFLYSVWRDRREEKIKKESEKQTKN